MRHGEGHHNIANTWTKFKAFGKSIINYDQSIKDALLTDNNIIVKASNNYTITEDKAVNEFKMIESVDDILKILKSVDDEKHIINLI